MVWGVWGSPDWEHLWSHLLLRILGRGSLSRTEMVVRQTWERPPQAPSAAKGYGESLQGCHVNLERGIESSSELKAGSLPRSHQSLEPRAQGNHNRPLSRDHKPSAGWGRQLISELSAAPQNTVVMARPGWNMVKCSESKSPGTEVDQRENNSKKASSNQMCLL